MALHNAEKAAPALAKGDPLELIGFREIAGKRAMAKRDLDDIGDSPACLDRRKGGGP